MVWLVCHTFGQMKMTLHIDEDLLTRVMEATGATSKTHAIDLALREVDRRNHLAKLTAEGLGLSSSELKEVFDPAYDLSAARAEEKPVYYGRKPRSGR